MTTFLNIEIGKPIQLKFLVKHLLFSLIWLLGLLVIIFRVDLFAYDFLQPEKKWIIRAIPYLYLLVVLVIMFFSRWYYNLALIFYPILFLFWFLPKQLLAKGKIYLFSNYVSNIFNFFKHFKRSIAHIVIFTTTVLIICLTDSNSVRVVSLFIFAYFYYRFVINYVRKSFSPPRLFGTDIEKSIDEIISSPDKGMLIIQSFEVQKTDEKLTEDIVRVKRLERLIIMNFLIEVFKDNISGFNGKKAFVISWIYQLIGFLVITLTFYTFVNYELFKIVSQNFKLIGVPNIFDFFYYTIKTITFGNIDSIIPQSVIARIVEILSFLTMGIFLLIIVTSVIFSLRQDRIGENIKKATQLCIMQNEVIAEHIKSKYQTDIQTFLNESSNIKTSLMTIRNIIDRLF